MCDIVSMRSDAIPGRYSCVECGRVMPLQESWRKGGDILSNFSTLFCEACAVKLNETAALGLSPIALTNMDKLNMGTFVPEFGVADVPKKLQEPQATTKVGKWSSYLTDK